MKQCIISSVKCFKIPGIFYQVIQYYVLNVT